MDRERTTVRADDEPPAQLVLSRARRPSRHASLHSGQKISSWAQLLRRLGPTAEDLLEEGPVVARREGPLSRESLVHGHAEGIDVAAAVQVSVAGEPLLGAHVIRGSEGWVRTSQRRKVGAARQPEVCQNHASGALKDQVRGLDISVDDADCVQVVKALGNPCEGARGLGKVIEWPLPEHAPERRPLDE